MLRVSPSSAAMALRIRSTVPALESSPYNRIDLAWQFLVAVSSMGNSQALRGGYRNQVHPSFQHQ